MTFILKNLDTSALEKSISTEHIWGEPEGSASVGGKLWKKSILGMSMLEGECREEGSSQVH